MRALHTAHLQLACPDAATARNLCAALAIESADGPDGSRTTWSATDARVTCAIEADEAGNLRAALHSALRLFDAALRTSQAGMRQAQATAGKRQDPPVG